MTRAPNIAELQAAADAADRLLDAARSGVYVDRDPAHIWFDDHVFAFERSPAHCDNQIVVVDRATTAARMVVWSPWEEPPFPLLKAVEA